MSRHKRISYIKSAIRIAGAILAMMIVINLRDSASAIVFGFGAFAFAEVLGLEEERAEK